MEVIYALLFFAAICVIIYFLYQEGKEQGYKEGQIDAINGKIVYKLVEFESGERLYVKDSELKDLIEHKIIEQ